MPATQPETAMVRTLDNPDAAIADTIATDAEPTRMTPPPLPAPDGVAALGVGSLDVEFDYSVKLNGTTVAIVSGFARLDAPAEDPERWTMHGIFLHEVEEAELADGEPGTGATGGCEQLDEQHFLYPLIKLAINERDDEFHEKWAEHLDDLRADADTPALVVADPPAPEPAPA
jgi:hypothetical protein